MSQYAAGVKCLLRAILHLGKAPSSSYAPTMETASPAPKPRIRFTWANREPRLIMHACRSCRCGIPRGNPGKGPLP